MKTILIAGSKEFECAADTERMVAEKLGEAVIREPGWRLLTGGAIGKGNRCGERKGGVDFHAALGAQRAIDDPEKEREKILTLHPRDGRNDLFEIGSVIRSRAKSTPARRFELVSRSDFIVLLEGHEGTAQIVEYSIATGKPVLPLACTGGESKYVWQKGQYRTELLQVLGLQDPSPELEMIENGLGTPDSLISTCIQIMIRLLRPSCFVVMPFNLPYSTVLWEEMLKPAIEKTCMTPVRADLIHKVGEIIEDITYCIAEAIVVIADITGTNPNVMYELGYAHALRKATILICNIDYNMKWDKDLPFDIRGMRVIPINPWKKEMFLENLTATLKQCTGINTQQDTEDL